MQLLWREPYVHPSGLTRQVFLFVHGDRGWCWRWYVSGALSVKWRVLYFIFFFGAFIHHPPSWSSSQGSCMSQRDRPRKFHCAEERSRCYWASSTHKSFSVRDGPKPDKSYSQGTDLTRYYMGNQCREASLIGSSWPVQVKLHAESNFLLTNSFTPGWVQGWQSERAESAEDLIQTVRWVGLFSGNLKGLKQAVDKSPKTVKEAEAVCVEKNLRKMRWATGIARVKDELESLRADV